MTKRNKQAENPLCGYRDLKHRVEKCDGRDEFGQRNCRTGQPD
jgi:hypothetical protein